MKSTIRTTQEDHAIDSHFTKDLSIKKIGDITFHCIGFFACGWIDVVGDSRL